MSKVAFVTGATRGIGKQIAITLAKDGYDIAVNYRTANEELEAVKKEIEACQVACLPVQGDVSKFEDTEKMAKEMGLSKSAMISVALENYKKGQVK